MPTCLPNEIDVVDLTWDGTTMFHVSYDGVLRHSREQGNNWQVLNSPFEGVNYTTSLRLAYGWRHFLSGIYFVKVVGDNASIVRKITIQH